jgi:hypothetical protein
MFLKKFAGGGEFLKSWLSKLVGISVRIWLQRLKRALQLAPGYAFQTAACTSPLRPSRELPMRISQACQVALCSCLAMAVSPALPNGATTGLQFAVTESGAATLSLPIQVPRGIGGMEPQLSLSYSSGGGNGLLGLGWSISGISAITRCPSSIEHDNEVGEVNFTTSDRFCLDGQRLLSVRPTTDANYAAPGTIYRTERDNFSPIRAVSSMFTGVNQTSLSFVVETKSRLSVHFGGTGDAPGLTPGTGPPPTVATWPGGCWSGSLIGCPRQPQLGSTTVTVKLQPTWYVTRVRHAH